MVLIKIMMQPCQFVYKLANSEPNGFRDSSTSSITFVLEVDGKVRPGSEKGHEPFVSHAEPLSTYRSNDVLTLGVP